MDVNEILTRRDEWWIGITLKLAADEPEGDHYLSHLTFARKVLREPVFPAVQLAAGYAHIRLTRDDCVWLLHEWRREGWCE